MSTVVNYRFVVVLLFCCFCWLQYVAKWGERKIRRPQEPDIGNIFSKQTISHCNVIAPKEVKAFQLPGVSILSTNTYQGLQLYPEVDMSKWILMPHSASSRFLKPLNDDASFQNVLLTGATTALWYPYRAVASTLENVHGISHPGYGSSSTEERKNFVEQIHQSAVGITDGSTLHYALAKIFEIPTTGQLLLLNDEMEPAMRRLGFCPGVHYISYNSNNIRAVVGAVLKSKNRDRVIDIRTKGQSLVKSIHTTRHRASQIAGVVSCIFYSRRNGNHSHCAPFQTGQGIIITSATIINNLITFSGDRWKPKEEDVHPQRTLSWLIKKINHWIGTCLPYIAKPLCGVFIRHLHRPATRRINEACITTNKQAIMCHSSSLPTLWSGGLNTCAESSMYWIARILFVTRLLYHLDI